MSTVSFHIEDVEYVIEIDSFQRGHCGSYWEPPEGGEICLSNIVEYQVGEHWEAITFDYFKLLYAADNELTLDKADERIHDEALEQAEEYAAEREGDD